MKKLLIATLAGIFAASVLVFAAPALADNEGQIEGGNIYRVKNITKNIDFTDPVTADPCDVVQYKVRIHNPGPGALTSVTVKAALPNVVATSHTSTVTVSAINANPQSTSDTAVVNVSKASGISYVNGSTQLLDANGNVISTLGDGVTSGGVNIGNVGVSINEKRFVQFKAKLECPKPPVTPPTPPTTPPAQELPNTGAGEVVGIVAGASAMGTALHYGLALRRARGEE